MEFKICRVCLEKSATVLLFEDENEGISHREKIVKCVSIRIEKDDGLPDAICGECIRDLLVSYEFVERCETSDKVLRNMKFELGKLELPQPPEFLKPEVKEESSIEDFTAQFDDSFIDDQFPEKIKVEFDHKDLTVLYHSAKKVKIKKKEPKKKNDKTKLKVKKNNEKPLRGHVKKNKSRVFSGPIQCPMCSLVIACHSAYQSHIRTHTKEKPFTCDLCNKCYRTKYTLQKHIIKHYNNIVLKKKPMRLDDGRRNRYKSPPILCVVCGLKVLNKSAMDIHMRSHTGERPFACEICGKSFTLKGSLVRHVTRHEEFQKPEKKFICEHCGKAFYTRTNIIVHLRTHTGEKPYKCPFCDLQFCQISSLIRHKRRHTGEKPFACKICDKAFIDQTLLKKHQSVHSDEKNFSCPICGKHFKTKTILKVHIDLHNNTRRYMCNICAKEFTIKGNLTSHMKLKHSETSGFCSLCNKVCSNIDLHMRIHNGEKPFMCKICDQAFTSKNGMAHHMNFKHRDSSKFKCSADNCNMSFPTMAMLEFHVLKQHLESSPYVCRHCERTFLRPSDLSRHLKVFHMDTQTQVKSQYTKTINLNNQIDI